MFRYDRLVQNKVIPLIIVIAPEAVIFAPEDREIVPLPNAEENTTDQNR
jgi:hypothetical protein